MLILKRNMRIKDVFLTKKGKPSNIALKLCGTGIMETIDDLIEGLEFVFDIEGLGKTSLHEIYETIHQLMTEEELSTFVNLSKEYEVKLKEKAKESQKKYVANNKDKIKAKRKATAAINRGLNKSNQHIKENGFYTTPEEAEFKESIVVTLQEPEPVQTQLPEQKPVIMGLMFDEDELEMISVLVSTNNGSYSRIRKSIMDKIQKYYNAKHPVTFESKHYPTNRTHRFVEPDTGYIDGNTFILAEDLDIFKWINSGEFIKGRRIDGAVRFGINTVQQDSEEQCMLIDFYDYYIRGTNNDATINFNVNYKLIVKDGRIHPVRER